MWIAKNLTRHVHPTLTGIILNVRTMKTKNTEWLPEEDAELRKAVETKVSPARLSVRLKRSEVSIKRRLRDLGLAAKSRSDAG
jgi:ParB-like chromosome segregation protein Spo0J